MKIESAANERVKNWAKLHQKKYRDETGLFLIENEHGIAEALSAEMVEELLVLDGIVNPFAYDAIEVSQAVLNKLSSNVSAVSYIAVCRQKMRDFPNEAKRVVILDNVQDPGNLGTIMRTAYSFGYDALILSNDSADMYNEKCIRSTQGALFHLPHFRMDLKEAITFLKGKGFQILATSLKDAVPLSKIEKDSEKTAIVFGNEGQGIKAEILNVADTAIKIEMNSFESLNVAVAAGICLYHYRNKEKE